MYVFTPGQVLMLIDSLKWRAVPYRILFVTTDKLVLIVIDREMLATDGGRIEQVPKYWDRKYIENRLDDQSAVLCSGGWVDPRIIQRWSSSDGVGRKESEQNYNVIRELVEDEPHIYDDSYRNLAIKEQAEKTDGASPNRIRKLLARYWINGKQSTWLVNTTFKCGISSSGKLGITGPQRLSHPNREERNNEQVDNEMRDKIKNYASAKSHIDHHHGNIELMYLDFIAKQLATTDDGQATLDYQFSFETLLSQEQVLTKDQFKYWFMNFVDRALLVSVQAAAQKKKHIHSRRGRTEDMAYRVGSYIQIDVCYPGVRLLDEKTKETVLPSPVVCIGVEPLSQLITSVHVGYEADSTREYRLLLYNMCEDKVEFCHRLGISITSEIWPWTYLSKRIFSDRGPGVAKAVDELAKELGFEAFVAPPYCPPAKGIIESIFKHLKIELFDRLPGSVNDKAVPGDPDTTQFACFTYNTFLKLLVSCVIFHNLGLIQVKSSVDPLASVLGVGTSPIERFQYLKEHEFCDFVTISPMESIVKLLPKAQGIVTDRGIKFADKIYYTSDYLEKIGLFKLAAMHRKLDPIEMRVDERNVSYATALVQGKMIPIHLTNDCLAAFFARNLKEAKTYIDLQRRASLYNPDIVKKLKGHLELLIQTEIQKSKKLLDEIRDKDGRKLPTREGQADAVLQQVVTDRAHELVKVFNAMKQSNIEWSEVEKSSIKSESINALEDEDEVEYDPEDQFRK